MKIVCVMTILALSAAPAAALAQGLELQLTCKGVASLGDAKPDNAFDVQGQGDPRPIRNEHRTSADTQVLLRFSGGGGSIKLPQALLANRHSNDSAGWRPLRDINAGADEITASFSMNMLNKPSFVIDRHSGEMTLRLGDKQFQGACDKSPPPAPVKF